MYWVIQVTTIEASLVESIKSSQLDIVLTFKVTFVYSLVYTLFVIYAPPFSSKPQSLSNFYANYIYHAQTKSCDKHPGRDWNVVHCRKHKPKHRNFTCQHWQNIIHRFQMKRKRRNILDSPDNNWKGKSPWVNFLDWRHGLHRLAFLHGVGGGVRAIQGIKSLVASDFGLI